MQYKRAPAAISILHDTAQTPSISITIILAAHLWSFGKMWVDTEETLLDSPGFVILVQYGVDYRFRVAVIYGFTKRTGVAVLPAPQEVFKLLAQIWIVVAWCLTSRCWD